MYRTQVYYLSDLSNLTSGHFNMRHVMRKPVYAICEQQRRRSSCASAQSDQRLCSHCLDSRIPLVSISEISSLYIASVAAQAGLSLPWSETSNTGFFVTRLIYKKDNDVTGLCRSKVATCILYDKTCIGGLKYNLKMNCILVCFLEYNGETNVFTSVNRSYLSGFATRYDSDRPAQPQKLRKCLKFRL